MAHEPDHSLKDYVKQLTFVFLIGVFFSVNGFSADMPAPDEATAVSKSSDPALKIVDNNKQSIVSAYKLNYIAMNNWFGSDIAQIKFQFSVKFRVLKPNLYFLKHDIFPAYVAYTQKSLWDVGLESLPFEETNYNPEFFLDYPLDIPIIGGLKLRSLIISPIEHESNGVGGSSSRSWNREYVMVAFGLESNVPLEHANSLISDRARFYIKLWESWGYADQNTYLQSIGISEGFLDYMGYGEVGLSVKNFLWKGRFRNHQLDIKTPIFRDFNKNAFEFEFRQQIPNMNFAIYLQYWLGYGETLLRFDQFGNRGFVGLSF